MDTKKNRGSPCSLLLQRRNAYYENSRQGEKENESCTYRYYGTFRQRKYVASVNSYWQRFQVSCVLHKRGASPMKPSIVIHDDFCADVRSENVQEILSAVTALIADAILRTTAQPGNTDSAA